MNGNFQNIAVDQFQMFKIAFQLPLQNFNKAPVLFHRDHLDRARRFYEGVFGWEIGEMEQFPNYFLFSFGTIDRAGGAIWLFWVIYHR